MFIGHYAVSFAAKRVRPEIPLWVLFVAVQLLDVMWAPFVLLGIEHVRIVPGITASNPLDLYDMPWTHGLPGALGWSVLAWGLWRATARDQRFRAGAGVVGLAVFSHWVLDFVVHRPDLPLWDNTAKVGLGLWNYPMPALALECGLLVAGLLLYLRGIGRSALPWLVFAAFMLAVHTIAFFGAPPATPAMAAIMALVAYVLLAGIAAWLERRSHAARGSHTPP
jgi:hypothetical protein